MTQYEHDFDLDHVPFTDAVNAIYLEPKALLADIYKDLVKVGISPFIAEEIAKKSLIIARNEIAKTFMSVVSNQVDISDWEASE